MHTVKMSINKLPRFMVVQSIHSGLYLRKVPEDVCKQNKYPENFVNFSGVDIESPLIKFEVEISKASPPYVHIRCCSNSLYLRRLDSCSPWIVASAEKPVEDYESVSCTVFDYGVNAKNQYKFIHAQMGYCPSLWTGVLPWKDGFYAGLESWLNSDEYCNVYNVLNWEELYFPKYVAFMRSSDKKYLRLDNTSDGQDQYYLKFTKTVLSDENVQHEIISLVDDKYPKSTVRIKCKTNGMFWKRTDPDNWVLAIGESTGCENDLNTLFETVKLPDSGVALNNIKNQMFCKSQFLDDDKECLIASAPDLNDQAKLQIVHITPQDHAAT